MHMAEKPICAHADIPHSYSSPVFESPEHGFYFMVLFIGCFVVGGVSLMVLPGRDAWCDALMVQGLPEPIRTTVAIPQHRAGFGQDAQHVAGAFMTTHLTS